MKIASFNVRNIHLSKFKKKKEASIKNLEVFFKMLNDEKIDILGTQELTYSHVKKLKPYLKGYSFYGKYRMPFKRIPINENNNVITNREVLKVENIKLPWIPRNFKEIRNNLARCTLIPRIATIIFTKDDNNNDICFINTHLTNRGKSLRRRQLDTLKKVIDKHSSYPIILTGDFNTTLEDDIFNDFVNDLKEYNLNRVEINENTFHNKKGNGRTIDHIFIPNNYVLKDYGIISSNNISDHDLLYVDIKKR